MKWTLLSGPAAWWRKLQPALLVVQSKSAYIALGMGIWLESTEGAKFWLKVINELKNRGVQDMIACCDGLKDSRAPLKRSSHRSRVCEDGRSDVPRGLYEMLKKKWTMVPRLGTVHSINS